ncbi:MAG: DUF4115 domain-containing protein, partial [Gammaproteobacteria bacterium]|nr:DUF4115 domain-containing protein [Gammaproteobacteria bacterium]
SEAMVREEAPAEASQTTVAGPDKLEVIVHADTWTDIKDVNGQRLVYDLLRADRRLKLAGVAPFTVFFGNGHGVEVIFNGQEVDIAGQTRDDNTVRLKIGSN